MPCDDGEEPLEAVAAGLDDLVREAVREDLSRERWDVHARRFTFEDIAEGLEVRVASTYGGLAKLEGRDVCLFVRIWNRKEEK